MEDIILNKEESVKFIECLINPDQEIIERRDKFLEGLKNTKITFTDNEILIQTEDISLNES